MLLAHMDSAQFLVSFSRLVSHWSLKPRLDLDNSSYLSNLNSQIRLDISYLSWLPYLRGFTITLCITAQQAITLCSNRGRY